MTQEFRHTAIAHRAGVWAELGSTLRALPSVETVIACVVVVAFALPIVTFSPPVDMNGINRAANQLSRKVVAGQDKPGVGGTVISFETVRSSRA